jgi:Type IV secretory system Conjugative DNA transfer
MWRDRDRYPEHHLVPDTFWLVAAALLFAACGLVWLIGQVAAILFGAHEHLPVRLVDMLGVLLRLPETWDDPAKAWPPSSQPLLPGPVGMYAAAVLTFWVPALLYGLLVRLVSPRARRQRKQRGAKWASWWQLRRLLVLGPRRGRIILGRRDRIRDRLLGRLYLAVEQCHSVLAFGPPGSFKTHGLVIPTILEWHGNLVTTSIKPDVLRATCAHRANLGAVWVYDPLGLAGVPGARWTPPGLLLYLCRSPPHRPHAGRRSGCAGASGRGRQLLAAAGRQAPVGAAVRGRRDWAQHGRRRPLGGRPGHRRRRHRVDGDRRPAGPGCLGGLHQPPRQHHGQCLRHRRDPPRRVRRPHHRRLGRRLRPRPRRAPDRRQQHPLPLRPRQRAGTAPATVRAPGLGRHLQGRAAGRCPTRRDARSPAVRVPG